MFWRELKVTVNDDEEEEDYVRLRFYEEAVLLCYLFI